MKFECPACGQHLSADDKHAGGAMVCQTCSATITVPAVPLIDVVDGQSVGAAPTSNADVTVLASAGPRASASAPWSAEPAVGPGTGRMIGQCRIERELGRGGMGAVYLATHTRLDVLVAVKVLPPHLAANNPGFVGRFVREARLAAKIRHPNVVSVLDVDQDEATGQYYIVQEYVGGGSVNDLLKKGPVDIARSLEIANGVAEALKAASEFQIIHRDIKPDNILLTKDGVAKLADLGLAKSTGDDPGLTVTNEVMGTPAYMAPEQVEGCGSVDARADIYSLGATLYNMVTGKRPFSGPTPASVMIKHMQEPLPPVRQVKPDVPEPVAVVIEKMLAKNPADRYQTAAELLEALTAARDGKIREANSEQLTSISDDGEKSGKGDGTGKWKWVAGGVAAAVLIVAGVGLGLSWKAGPARTAEAPRPAGYELWKQQGQDAIGYWGENEYGMKFRYIVPGSLKIGMNRVLAVTNGYWMQTTEMTQGQWTKLGLTNPSAFANGPDYPVEQVAWADCADAARRLGPAYRLPTGDEWEYACRAGSTTEYCFGDNAAFLGEYAWHSGNAGGKTHPVRKKKPNSWGLYDMHGNVWEWTSDREGGNRVLRGGSWNYNTDNYRSAYRSPQHPDLRINVLGFRVVVSR